MKEGFAVTEFIGDYQLENQHHWGVLFPTLEGAKTATQGVYDARVTTLKDEEWNDYYVVISKAFGKDGRVTEDTGELINVGHGGRIYVGESAKTWEEMVLPHILNKP